MYYSGIKNPTFAVLSADRKVVKPGIALQKISYKSVSKIVDFDTNENDSTNRNTPDLEFDINWEYDDEEPVTDNRNASF